MIKGVRRLIQVQTLMSLPLSHTFLERYFSFVFMSLWVGWASRILRDDWIHGRSERSNTFDVLYTRLSYSMNLFIQIFSRGLLFELCIRSGDRPEQVTHIVTIHSLSFCFCVWIYVWFASFSSKDWLIDWFDRLGTWCILWRMWVMVCMCWIIWENRKSRVRFFNILRIWSWPKSFSFYFPLVLTCFGFTLLSEGMTVALLRDTPWGDMMHRLAKHSSAFCKISGLILWLYSEIVFCQRMFILHNLISLWIGLMTETDDSWESRDLHPYIHLARMDLSHLFEHSLHILIALPSLSLLYFVLFNSWLIWCWALCVWFGLVCVHIERDASAVDGDSHGCTEGERKWRERETFDI